MKNIELWKPSKFIRINGKLRGIKDRGILGIYSRLNVDLIAQFYDQNLKLYVKGKLIDLGCGRVPLYESYKDYADEIICVDWENTQHQNLFLDYEMDLNKQLLFPDGTFDTIILSDVFEHIRKPENLMKEMYRILKINGKLLMNVPFFYWLHEVPFDYFRYTEFALRTMAEDYGFRIIKLEPLGGIPEIFADMISKLVIKVPVLGVSIGWILYHFTLFFIKTRIGIKVSRKTAKYFPIGYAMIVEKPYVNDVK